ncbi:MAG: TonB-dependent receptor [bacterium]
MKRSHPHNSRCIRCNLLVVLLFIVITPLLSQTESSLGTITGTVKSDQGELLIGANVYLLENRLGTSSDLNGNFTLRSIKLAEYTLRVSYMGYKSVAQKVTVRAGSALRFNIVLETTSYTIGGMTVFAESELMPKEAETKTLIRSDNIEHLQASSLGDVMQLIPGVKSSNPGLVSVQQANLRGSDRDVTAQSIGSFGTQIMIDNVPTSNNANMQIDAAPTATTSRGIDLRSIPTENIDNIEIIRGIPSARHGDLTSGIIRVTTKTGQMVNRLKFKYNPNTYEGNLSGGVNLWETGLGYNINVASSERDIRRPGDGYTRIAFQLSSITRFLAENQLSVKNILYFTRAFDEMKEDPAYAARTAYYNRDINVKYTLNSSYRLDAQSALNAVLSVAYTRQNSFKQDMVSRDNVVLSDRLTPGVTAGRFALGSYLSQYWVKGDVWNLYANLDWEDHLEMGNFIHTVAAGIKWQYDVNRGPGRIYDSFYPPWNAPNVGDRPRSYNELPGLSIASLFLEDRIAGTFWKPFTLQIGVRYEMFDPYGLSLDGFLKRDWIVKSRQGSFLDPRVNFSMNIFEETQLRVGYGITSKAPPLSMIYPNLRYYDVVDTVAINPQDPSKNFSLLSTYIFNRGNENLHGYRQTKYEASIDQQLGDMGISLTGFINKTDGGFGTMIVPITLLKKSWPRWPDQSVVNVKDTLMEKIIVSNNSIWSDARGVELTLKTRRIPSINTVLEFDLAYTYYKSGQANGLVFGGQRLDTRLGTYLFPIHKSETRVTEDLLLKYRFDIHLKELRMWLTIHIEQQMLERDGYRGRSDTLAVGYFTKAGQLMMIPEAERGTERYSGLQKHPQEYEYFDEDRPNKWLVNLRVSKELWSGTEVSFFVNNFFNHHPLYRSLRTDPLTFSYERRNPPIYFGLEMSAVLDALWKESVTR